MTASRLDALAANYPLPTWKPLARGIMLVMIIMMAWSVFAQLDEVTVTNGEVVPEGKVKVIQHLEGGIIREIHVQEGQMVKESAPLVQLDLAVTSINRDELQVRIDGLVLARARLLAEATGQPLAFPADESRRQPRLLEAEKRNYEARQRALESAVSVLEQQLRQKGLEVQELVSKQRSASSNLKLSRERFNMSADLLRSGLTSRMDHVQLQREVETLEGDLATLASTLPRSESAMAEARARIQDERLRYSRQARQELTETEVNIARNKELLNQATDQQTRTLIQSPIEGVVKNMRYNTIGGVVRPGEAIMEIVPLKERLQIEAKLSPADRGYVQIGQKAVVKITAYDFTRYGGLDGIVTLVAADTTTPTNSQEQPYYRVVVQTDRSWLGGEEGQYPITPGMQASVDIHTGTRSVLNYIVKPVLKLRHEAFREP